MKELITLENCEDVKDIHLHLAKEDYGRLRDELGKLVAGKVKSFITIGYYDGCINGLARVVPIASVGFLTNRNYNCIPSIDGILSFKLPGNSDSYYATANEIVSYGRGKLLIVISSAGETDKGCRNKFILMENKAMIDRLLRHPTSVKVDKLFYQITTKDFKPYHTTVRVTDFEDVAVDYAAIPLSFIKEGCDIKNVSNLYSDTYEEYKYIICFRTLALSYTNDIIFQ